MNDHLLLRVTTRRPHVIPVGLADGTARSRVGMSVRVVVPLGLPVRALIERCKLEPLLTLLTLSCAGWRSPVARRRVTMGLTPFVSPVLIRLPLTWRYLALLPILVPVNLLRLTVAVMRR